MRKWKQAALASAVATALIAASPNVAAAETGPRASVPARTIGGEQARVAAELAAKEHARSSVNDAARERTSAEGDARVYEAIRIADNGRRVTETVPINTAELTRARAAGEIQTTEATLGRVREYVQVGTGEKVLAAGQAGPQASGQSQSKARDEIRSGAQTKTAVDEKGRATGQAAIVYLPDAKDRAAGQARLQVTEAARAAEHARYEANKKRRTTETAAVQASEQAKARMNEQTPASTEAKAGVSAQTRAEINLQTKPAEVAKSAAEVRASPLERVGADPLTSIGNASASASEEARARAIISDLR